MKKSLTSLAVCVALCLTLCNLRNILLVVAVTILNIIFALIVLSSCATAAEAEARGWVGIFNQGTLQQALTPKLLISSRRENAGN